MRQDNNWIIIKRLIKEAGETCVEQEQMPSFLKKTFALALDALEDLVRNGVDLNDKNLVANVKELELALAQIPQHRVFAFDAASVIEDFEPYEDRFLMILSYPRQDAENSIVCPRLMKKLEALSEQITEDILEDETLDSNEEKKQALSDKTKASLAICHELSLNGSDGIKAFLVDAAEDLAHALSSADMQRAARGCWRFVVDILSEENPRITQRKIRLMNAKEVLIRMETLFTKEMTTSEVEVFLPEAFNPKNIGDESREFREIWSTGKRIILCEVVAEGYADEVAERMINAVELYGQSGTDILYYIDVGDLNNTLIFNPDISVLMNMLGERYNVQKWTCHVDPITTSRYSRALIGVILKD